MEDNYAMAHSGVADAPDVDGREEHLRDQMGDDDAVKIEAWIFAISTAFFVVVSPAYWLIAGDWTGTSALVMTTLLVAMVTLYLGFHAAKMERAPGGPQGRRDRRRRGRAGLLPAVLLVAAVVRRVARR